MTQPPKEILKLIADELGEAQSIKQLSGGRTNSVWRVQAQSRVYVCKYFANCTNNPIFPNSPRDEITALNALKGAGIAPHLFAVRTRSNIRAVIYEFIDGSIWSEDIDAVSKLMKKLHQFPPPNGLRKVPMGAGNLINQIKLLSGKKFHELEKFLPQIVDSQDVAPVFMHGDPVAGNIVQTEIGARFIDWQCPAIGDPCEDIAIFLSSAMQHLYRGKELTRAQQKEFLNQYGNARVSHRYLQLEPFFRARMTAYCWWKLEQGEAEYKKAAEIELSGLKNLSNPNTK